MNQRNEPIRHALLGTEVEEWINGCAPEGTFLQQTPRRTCGELGVCQHRTPACGGCEPIVNLRNFANQPQPEGTTQPVAPHTVWQFKGWDLVAAVALVALAYFSAGYNG